MQFQYIDKIVAGAATEHLSKKLLSWNKPDPANCFAVFSPVHGTLSLEAKTSTEASEWIRALQMVKECHVNFSVGLG